MSEKDGGSAFPIDGYQGEGMGMTRVKSQGMSLRDFFAAHALEGHVSNHNLLKDATSSDMAQLCFMNAAAFAYRLADAMLAERAK